MSRVKEFFGVFWNSFCGIFDDSAGVISFLLNNPGVILAGLFVGLTFWFAHRKISKTNYLELKKFWKRARAFFVGAGTILVVQLLKQGWEFLDVDFKILIFVVGVMLVVASKRAAMDPVREAKVRAVQAQRTAEATEQAVQVEEQFAKVSNDSKIRSEVLKSERKERQRQRAEERNEPQDS